MAYLKVEWEQWKAGVLYTSRFNPWVHAIDESSDMSVNFEDCLIFIMSQFKEGTKLIPSMGYMELEVTGDLPEKEKLVLEGIVELYNNAPILYDTFLTPTLK
ncbi:hypothetical protein CL622_08085 [archaeon]|nr:hypothetical protein [archaeon]|tara:strand:+ start:1161 stop:1466 length:306 start_codon:yes stop_codon:yes gene_type:complete